MTETTFLNYATADFSTIADMELIYRKESKEISIFLPAEILKTLYRNSLQSLFNIYPVLFSLIKLINLLPLS